MNPAALLKEGCKFLDPIMISHGFTFSGIASGKGSGGNFATAQYSRGDLHLEFHFRYSLGMVRYHIGSLSASHHSYMRVLFGSAGGNHYPGFSDDPLDGFRHLSHDLQNFCQDFLSGGGRVLEKAAMKEAAEDSIQQKIDMARSVGDMRRREEARQHFRQKDYQAVVDELEGLEYPELMTESERKMLEMAKQKLR